jgi:LuxR family maltose regulon positive regulatory protein
MRIRAVSYRVELALDPGSIGEYLTNEVLHRQPEPQRRLLIETSFLEEVTGPLADAVTGMTGCGDMLASLARENSFVIPLDAAQERYRYHQLFAEILRYLLRRQKRQAYAACRSARWPEVRDQRISVTRSTGPCGQATGTTSSSSWPGAGSRTRS